MAGFRMEAPVTSLGSTIKQGVSGALASGAATYLDGVATGLAQYGTENAAKATATAKATVKKSGVLGALGLTQTSTLVTVAVVLVVLMIVLR